MKNTYKNNHPTYILVLIKISLLSACQPIQELKIAPSNLQQKVNITKIAAVPCFIVPDPCKQNRHIDNVTLITAKIIKKIEDKILDSFKNQPNTNGYSYSEVEKAIEKSSKPLLTQMADIINLTNKTTGATNPKKRSYIKDECIQRKNTYEFYKYCLLNQPGWIDKLNELSEATQYSDASLITFVTHVSFFHHKSRYFISIGLAILLVDTNNGMVLWKNEATETLEKVSGYPEWNDLIDKILSEDFWREFPGRKEKKSCSFQRSSY